MALISRSEVIPPNLRIQQPRNASEDPKLQPPQVPINDDVEWIVLKALRQTSQQYRTAGELSDDIKKYLRGERVRPAEEPRRREQKPASLKPPAISKPSPDRRRFSIVAAAATACALLVAAVGWRWTRPHAPSQDSGNIVATSGSHPSSAGAGDRRNAANDVRPVLGNLVPTSMRGASSGTSTRRALSAAALVKNPAPINGLVWWTFTTVDPLGDGESITYSPDGEELAISGDEPVIRIYRVRDGTLLRAFLHNDQSVRSLRWARQIIASASDHDVFLCDAHSGAVIAQLPAEFSPFGAITMSPDGLHIAAVCGKNRHIEIWDIAGTGLARHEGVVPDISSTMPLPIWDGRRTESFSPSCKLRARCACTTVRLCRRHRKRRPAARRIITISLISRGRPTLLHWQ